MFYCRTRVDTVQPGCKWCHIVNITYNNGVTYQQGRTVVQQHSTCKYHYKHECHDNGLLTYSDPDYNSYWIAYDWTQHSEWTNPDKSTVCSATGKPTHCFSTL